MIGPPARLPSFRSLTRSARDARALAQTTYLALQPSYLSTTTLSTPTSMRIHKCLARPAPSASTEGKSADSDDPFLATSASPTSDCPNMPMAPSPFCSAHHAEYSTLRAAKAAAAREAERLRPLVEGVLTDGASASDARGRARDLALAKVYAEALGEAARAARELTERFYCDGECGVLTREIVGAD